MRRFWILSRLYLQLLWSGFWAMPRLVMLRRASDAGAEFRFMEAHAVRWARHALAAAGARVQVTGLERIPPSGPVLYVANHQGVFDIPVMMAHLPGCPAFVAKQELFRIPFLGYWMFRLGCVPIDRSNRRAGHLAISAAAQRVRRGRRMVLFPEGTRSRDPEGKMMPFKRGAFKLAVQAEATVVPVTVEGSRFLLYPGALPGRAGEVHLLVGEPVDVSRLDEEGLRQLPDTLFRTISETRERYSMGRIEAKSFVP